jgi:hypothetical protein
VDDFAKMDIFLQASFSLVHVIKYGVLVQTPAISGVIT